MADIEELFAFEQASHHNTPGAFGSLSARSKPPRFYQHGDALGLKDRMLMVVRGKASSKHEWIVLPVRPSRLQSEAEIVSQ